MDNEMTRRLESRLSPEALTVFREIQDMPPEEQNAAKEEIVDRMAVLSDADRAALITLLQHGIQSSRASLLENHMAGEDDQNRMELCRDVAEALGAHWSVVDRDAHDLALAYCAYMWNGCDQDVRESMSRD